MNSNAQVYIGRGGQKLGPFSREQLASGQVPVQSGDLGWMEGMAQWESADQVLARLDIRVPAMPPPMPPGLPPPLARPPLGTPGSPSQHGSNVAASHLPRFAASVIDGVICITGLVVVVVLMEMLGIGSDGDEGSVAALYILIILGQMAYFTLMQASEGMATLGKRALGLIVVSRSGQPMTIAQGAGRYAVLLLSSLFTLPLAVILFSRNHRGLHDMAVNTVVIQKGTWDRAVWNMDDVRAAPGGGGSTALAIAALSVPVLGILAAIAIPAYQDYVVRSKVSNVITQEAAPVQRLLEQFLASNPFNLIVDRVENYGQIGLDGPLQAESLNATIAVSSSAEVVITFNEPPLTGKQMSLAPVEERGMVTWNCSAGDVPHKFVPPSCRH